MQEHYSGVPVYVMANGVQEDPARFKDSLRVYYLYNYINEALKGGALRAATPSEHRLELNVLPSCTEYSCQGY